MMSVVPAYTGLPSLLRCLFGVGKADARTALHDEAPDDVAELGAFTLVHEVREFFQGIEEENHTLALFRDDQVDQYVQKDVGTEVTVSLLPTCGNRIPQLTEASQ